MAKSCSTVILNACCTFIRDNAAKISVCSAQPTNVTEADVTYMLAVTSLTTGASTSFTIADSSISGKKITVAEQATIAVDSTGVPTNIALYSTVTGVLYYVTDSSTDALTSTSNKVTIPAWAAHFKDAT